MSDLVKRLRGYAEDPMWGAHAEVPKPLIVDAANRIEALELRKQELLKLLEENSKIMMKAAAHITKLEAALRDLIGNVESGSYESTGQAIGIARAALNPKE